MVPGTWSLGLQGQWSHRGTDSQEGWRRGPSVGAQSHLGLRRQHWSSEGSASQRPTEGGASLVSNAHTGNRPHYSCSAHPATECRVDRGITCYARFPHSTPLVTPTIDEHIATRALPAVERKTKKETQTRPLGKGRNPRDPQAWAPLGRATTGPFHNLQSPSVCADRACPTYNRGMEFLSASQEIQRSD